MRLTVEELVSFLLQVVGTKSDIFEDCESKKKKKKLEIAPIFLMSVTDLSKLKTGPSNTSLLIRTPFVTRSVCSHDRFLL